MLGREGLLILRMWFKFEVGGHGRKGRLKRTWMSVCGGGVHDGWFRNAICMLSITVDC